MRQGLMLCITLFAAACGHSGSTPEGQGTGAAEIGAQSSSKVGAGGGTLSTPAGTATVVAPAGALTGDVQLTVVVQSPAGAPQAQNIITNVYNFGPTGTAFAKPVTLTLKTSTAPPAGTDAVMAYLDGASVWQFLPDSVYNAANGAITASASHFTAFTVLAVTPNQVVCSQQQDANAFCARYQQTCNATTNVCVPKADEVTGRTPLLQTLDAATSAQCPAGGQQIAYGIDSNGDGHLSTDEITAYIPVCNGLDGAGALCATTALGGGQQCPSGGVSLTCGPDTNRNNMLDSAEISTSSALCTTSGGGAGTAITSLTGSYIVSNSQDLAFAATYTSISGSLSVDATSNSNILYPFPALTTVGGDIAVTSNTLATANILTQIAFPRLQSINGALRVTLNAPGSAVQAPQLVSASSVNLALGPQAQLSLNDLSGTGALSINCNTLTASLPSLGAVDFINLYGNDSNLAFPALTDANNISLNGQAMKASFSRLTTVRGGGVNVSLDSNSSTAFPQLRSAAAFSCQDANTVSSPNLQSVDGYFACGDGSTMPMLTSIGNLSSNSNLSFSALTSVGELSIYQGTVSAPALQRVSDLFINNYLTGAQLVAPNLTTLTGGFVSQGNLTASVMHVLAQTQILKGGLSLTSSNANVLDLSQLQSVGGVSLQSNPGLTAVNLSSLTTLTPADSNHLLSNNYNSCASYLTGLSTSLGMCNNPNLTSVTLGPINTIPGALIVSNTRLASLQWAGGLTSAGLLTVSSNSNLFSLAGLEGLRSATGAVQVNINGNPNVTDLTPLQNYVSGNPTSCQVSLSGNGFGYCTAARVAAHWGPACAATLPMVPDSTVFTFTGGWYFQNPCTYPNQPTCSGSTPNCVVDCTQTQGYACQ